MRGLSSALRKFTNDSFRPTAILFRPLAFLRTSVERCWHSVPDTATHQEKSSSILKRAPAVFATIMPQIGFGGSSEQNPWSRLIAMILCWQFAMRCNYRRVERKIDSYELATLKWRGCWALSLN